jgi:hypothetical protein
MSEIDEMIGVTKELIRTKLKNAEVISPPFGNEHYDVYEMRYL